ncbi:S41 family peptidase [Pseudoalteromonas luteoviolacea]|uniref:Tail specific protease domain-containing protein n=1 Tax=Pseudoalteromonas luteoviolacea S4054 TaxID=1129367 RepID=A0A0F6A6Q1_9GAMM|nr:S41 family peptidase [Pseudoalteromonas luteoviolacea]AOT10978.1 hypothetical protein S4054249_24380 [Pseudoalteromonas luteoviolacea]AOT15858.1 hypothetical protein S40542_24130 [Pseudoalteromonas luteoviolacea]AOT20799.1 hypothetical protein S4054_24300 [Pseudoalteromonas luteoviolacea]KKE81877.1 hypothetical protein N479_20805 [Pseudoalteromonas luteoviolacea S4054]KZN72208.1 hypothetical protein N481_16100 [Pseudoalteromonas luteoviolacea S4047-1]
MFSKILYNGIYASTLLAISSSIHAAPIPEISLENNTATKTQLEQALPDILTFNEFVHRVRFFYPSEAVSSTWWDFFLEKVINEMAMLPEQERLAYGLAELKKIAPHIVTQPSKLPSLEQDDVVSTWVATAARTITAYNRELLSGSFSELLNYTDTAKSQFYKDVYDNQTVYWPLYLDSQESQNGQAFIPAARKSSLTNPATCMSALSSLWAEIYHYWPYFDQVPVNWEDSHIVLLEGCLGNPSNLENVVNIEFKKLQDNHFFIGLASELTDRGDYMLPLKVNYIESKAIVTRKTDYLSLQVDIGDELVSIDGVPSEELIQQAALTRARSDHADELGATFGIVEGFKTPSLVSLVFRKPNGEFVRTTTATVHKDVIGEFKVNYSADQPLVQDLGDGIVRLNVYDIGTKAQFNEAKQGLINAKAIVLDMRGYPRNFFLVREFMGYFSDKAVTVGPFMQFSQRLPNQEDTYVHTIPVGVPLNEHLFDVPTVAISEVYNKSAGEHFLMIAQNMGIPIVGEVTIGINGDVVYGWAFSRWVDDGGIFYAYTGARSDQVDGSKLIGVGIQPDYVVPKTQISIADNIDVKFEKAYEVIQDMLNK